MHMKMTILRLLAQLLVACSLSRKRKERKSVSRVGVSRCVHTHAHRPTQVWRVFGSALCARMRIHNVHVCMYA